MSKEYLTSDVKSVVLGDTQNSAIEVDSKCGRREGRSGLSLGQVLEVEDGFGGGAQLDE